MVMGVLIIVIITIIRVMMWVMRMVMVEKMMSDDW